MTVYFSDFHPLETVQGAKGSAAFAGTTNIAILQLYKRSATTLSNSDKPNGSVTYTFATATSNLSNITNGWTSTIPSGSDPLYVVGATAASSDATDTIASNEWSTPVILVQNGAGGLNTATVFLFKRGNTSSPPALPTQAATYTFATGVAIGSSSAGNTVSPYLDGWTQTAPDSAGNKYLFITTAAAISTGATSTINPSQWAEVKILAQDGAQGYTGYLTNESHTLPATSGGAITSYSGASGLFKVFLDGTGDISNSFSISVLANPQTLTVSTSTLPAPPSYTVTGGFDALEETASITLRAQGTGAYAGVVLDKVFSLSKANAGTDGAPSKLLSLSSSRQLISYDSANNLSPSIQDTVLSVVKQNTTSTVNWTIQNTLGTTLTPATYLSATTGDSVTLTAANFNSAIGVGPSEGVVVTATATDGVVISDRVTIMKVKAGTAGVNSATVSLYQRSATTPTSPSGTFTYTFSTGVLSGGTIGSWTQSIPSGTNPLYVITASAISNSATVNIPAVDFSSARILAQDGSPGANGVNNATVNLYLRSATVPANLTGSFTYTFGTNAITPSIGSWSQSIPSGTDPLYVISALASSNTSTATISFSSPILFTQNGSNASVLTLSSTAQTITFDGGGSASPSSQTISFTANLQNISGTAVFTATAFNSAGTNLGTITLGGTGNTRTLSNTLFTTFTNTSYVVVTATLSGFSDTITVARLQAGAPGVSPITGFLTNEASTLAATNNGTVSDFSPAGGTFKVFEGVTDRTSSATFSVFSNTNCTVAITSLGVYSVSAMTADTATATLRATYSGVTIDKVLSISKSRQGGIGDPGGPGPAAISGYVTNEAIQVFAFANGNVSSYAGASGSFRVFSGNTDISSSFTLATQENLQGLTITYSLRDYSISGGFDANEDTASIMIRATGTGAYAGVTVDKIVTLSKIKGGYEIVSALPTTNNFEGRVVFLTTDDKLYRFNGTAFTAAVPAVDISGTIGNSQIADGAITETKVGDNAISSAKIAANAITAGKIYAGVVQADRIQANNIATNAITSDKINAGAVIAGKIATDAVVADNIDVASLSAISATIGTLKTASTGGRVEISDNIIKVYDASSTSATTGLRVKIGNLTL